MNRVTCDNNYETVEVLTGSKDSDLFSECDYKHIQYAENTGWEFSDTSLTYQSKISNCEHFRSFQGSSQHVN